MTKQELMQKWGDLSRPLKTDLEAVIAHEVAKAKEQPQPEEAKPQPDFNPISEAFERGEKIRHKNWLYGDWIQKHKETKIIDNHGNINSVYPFAFIQHPEKWEIYTEPTEQPAQPSSQVKLDNSFDRERFEAMFRAVVASGEFMTIVEEIEQAEIYLTKLDAYYASKEGGNNG